jgi:hypothetical protein
VAEFGEEDLSGSTFDWTDLSGSTFRYASLSDVMIRGTDLYRVRMRDVELRDVDISGEIEQVVINGVDVTAYVHEELVRRDPLLGRLQPDDRAGFVAAWDELERLWEETVSRARALDPALLDESVDDEWSFIQTLRHLLFASSAWLNRAVLGEPAPFHALALPWSTAPPLPHLGLDVDARPSARAPARAAGRRPAGAGGADRRAARLRGDARGRGVAAATTVQCQEVPADPPQRGVLAPAVRRARPGDPGVARRELKNFPVRCRFDAGSFVEWVETDHSTQ